MYVKGMFLYKWTVALHRLYVNKLYKYRYVSVLKNIRLKKSNEKPIKICFLINEISKWKGQSLYELLEKDPYFSPFVGLTFADVDWELSSDVREKRRQTLVKYFTDRRMAFSETCIEQKSNEFSFSKIEADIIFYQQPWSLHDKQKPEVLSKTSLLCYFPYYVPNYSLISNDCKPEFHYKLWKYFQLSQFWVDAINEEVPAYTRAVDIVATGHPMLDCINNKKVEKSPRMIVIYSPHWSVYSEVFDNKERYSTFQHNGQEILKYAQRHPEIDWYFKPHPTLKTSLLRTRLMTQMEIDSYYAEWGKIGTICTNGDYTELFWKSSALITDCASFLVEYPCTGNPIIHLISSTCKVPIPRPSKKLFETYYQVHNLKEMEECFDMVLCKRLDPLYEIRMKAVREAGLCEVNASMKIIKHLYDCLNIR